MGLVEVAGSTGMFEQATTRNRPPHGTLPTTLHNPLLAGLSGRLDAGHVRGHDMGMEERVAGTARAMLERRRDDPIRGDESPVATTEAREHGTVFVVADHFVDRVAVRVPNRGLAFRISKRPENAHTLRWSKRQVIPRPEPGLTSAGNGASRVPEIRRRLRNDFTVVGSVEAGLVAVAFGEESPHILARHPQIRRSPDRIEHASRFDIGRHWRTRTVPNQDLAGVGVVTGKDATKILRVDHTDQTQLRGERPDHRPAVSPRPA